MVRTWRPGAPEPADHPDVVDAEGDVWAWEAAGGWWLRTGPFRGGDLWPWSEVTSTGPVREQGGA